VQSLNPIVLAAMQAQAKTSISKFSAIQTGEDSYPGATFFELTTRPDNTPDSRQSIQSQKSAQIYQTAVPHPPSSPDVVPTNGGEFYLGMDGRRHFPGSIGTGMGHDLASWSFNDSNFSRLSSSKETGDTNCAKSTRAHEGFKDRNGSAKQAALENSIDVHASSHDHCQL
jgi:hypothetical protein